MFVNSLSCFGMLFTFAFKTECSNLCVQSEVHFGKSRATSATVQSVVRRLELSISCSKSPNTSEHVQYTTQSQPRLKNTQLFSTYVVHEVRLAAPAQTLQLLRHSDEKIWGRACNMQFLRTRHRFCFRFVVVWAQLNSLALLLPNKL